LFLLIIFAEEDILNLSRDYTLIMLVSAETFLPLATSLITILFTCIIFFVRGLVMTCAEERKLIIR